MHIIKILTLTTFLSCLGGCGYLDTSEEVKYSRAEKAAIVASADKAVAEAIPLSSRIKEDAIILQSSQEEESSSQEKADYVLVTQNEKVVHNQRDIITKHNARICFTANANCLSVYDDGKTPRGTFNGYDFNLVATGKLSKFFHDKEGVTKAFDLVADINGVLINIATVNVELQKKDTYLVMLRTNDATGEYLSQIDSDSVISFDDNGEMTSCVTKPLKKGANKIVLAKK